MIACCTSEHACPINCMLVPENTVSAPIYDVIHENMPPSIGLKSPEVAPGEKRICLPRLFLSFSPESDSIYHWNTHFTSSCSRYAIPSMYLTSLIVTKCLDSQPIHSDFVAIHEYLTEPVHADVRMPMAYALFLTYSLFIRAEQSATSFCSPFAGCVSGAAAMVGIAFDHGVVKLHYICLRNTEGDGPSDISWAARNCMMETWMRWLMSIIPM